MMESISLPLGLSKGKRFSIHKAEVEGHFTPLNIVQLKFTLNLMCYIFIVISLITPGQCSGSVIVLILPGNHYCYRDPTRLGLTRERHSYGLISLSC